jgi:hypothetical protein
MIINEAKIYDREYVEKVLGIRIPLQESIFGYSSEFRARIIKEHLLYEGFIDTLKQAAGLVVNTANQAVGAAGQAVSNAVQSGVQRVQQFADNVKNLAKALYGVMTDGGLLEGYLSILKQRLFEMTKPLRNLFTRLEKFFEALPKLLSKFPKVKETIDSIKPTYEKAKKIVWESLLNPINSLAGWTGALAGSTIYVLIQWIRSKIGDVLADNELIQNIDKVLKFINNPKEAVKEDVINFVIEKLSKILTPLVTKALKEISPTLVGSVIKGAFTAFAPWIEKVAEIVGNVDWVARALAPITSTYAQRVTAGQQPAPQPGKIDLRRTIAASGQASNAFGQPTQPAAAPTPQPAPIREHMDIASLLAYLID